MNPRDKILDGDLQTLGLQATLKMLANSGKTGQLSVNTTPERNDPSRSRDQLNVFLKKGDIVALDSVPPPQIDLLELFRLLHRLTRKESREIRENSGTVLPQTLAELAKRHIITPAELQQRIEFAIIQEVARALRWEHGTFEFLTNVNVIDTTLTPLSVDHVLLEAIRMVDEWNKASTLALDRNSVVRWAEFGGDISALPITTDDVNVLYLCNGQHPIYAIANALLIPEARVAQRIESLIGLNLLEIVDNQVERQLEQSLINALTVGQSLLVNDNRLNSQQRLQMLIEVMGTSINKLLSHHSIFARALRGRNLPRSETVRYLASAFMPLLQSVQQMFPISESIVFGDGQIEYADLLNLPSVVRGDQLEPLFLESAIAFQYLMNGTFQLVVNDEMGPTHASRRFIDTWEIFAQEIAAELQRHQARRTAPPRRGTLQN